MKFNKIFLAVAAVAALIATSAQAQLGFDSFSISRTYVLAAPQNLGAGSGVVTNGPIDKVKLTGTGKIDFLTVTNTGTTGGTLTAQIYTSVDTTNLVALANYALITSPTTDSITNLYYGTNGPVANNSVLLPGTVTYPTAYSAGFNTPYLAPALFTNTGAITLNGNKTVQVGIRVTDTPRYIYVVYTPGGSVTNFTTAALLTAQSGY